MSDNISKSLNKKKINDVKIELIPVEKTNFKGDEFFNEPYPICYLLAKRKTGKTTILYNFVKKYVNENSYVYIFCSKVFSDPNYLAIAKYIKSKGGKVFPESSLYNGKTDQLEELINFLENSKSDDWDDFVDRDDDEMSDDVKNLMKSKNIIILIDDLAQEIRNSSSIKNLAKSNRHLRARVFLSTQYLTDLQPDALNQFSHCLIFAGLPKEKPQNRISELHNKIGIDIPYDKFEKIYLDATAPDKKGEKSHNFLYINTDTSELRKNFNEIYE